MPHPREVGFVVQSVQDLLAIEAKTGRRKDVLHGLADLAKVFALKRTLVVESGGVSLDELLSRPVAHWLAWPGRPFRRRERLPGKQAE